MVWPELHPSVIMALYPMLLELQRDSNVFATHQNTSFLLSLRDPQEFSSIHSFGLFKVPHIGKPVVWLQQVAS